MAEKAKRVTAASVVKTLLARKTWPADEAIIKEVCAKSGSKKFDKRHLAWYKCQFKKGNLTTKTTTKTVAKTAKKRPAPVEREAVAA